jgi:hypothetical protein
VLTRFAICAHNGGDKKRGCEQMKMFPDISRKTLDLIRAHAQGDFRQGAESQSDGLFSVPLSDETIERIEQYRMDGETNDDVLFRIMSGKAN